MAVQLPSASVLRAAAPAAREPTGIFPSRSGLPVVASWRPPLIIGLGSATLITVSLGPMAAELGNASVLVWSITALVGAAQCVLLAELTSRFPSRAGGTPQYAQCVLRRRPAMVGPLSSWSYWLAWTPGIAVNLILAAKYLQATVWSGLPAVPAAVACGVLLYGLNALGLRLSMAVAGAAASLALLPLAVLLMAPVLEPHLFHVDRVVRVDIPGDHDLVGSLALILKWSFVAAWAAYGAEMASTLAAEVRHGERVMPRVMAASAAITTLTFVAVPVVLLGLAGVDGLTQDPTTSFLPAARLLFGEAGAAALAVMMAATLLLTAQAFVVGSSRTIYQMAADGYLPALLGRVNRRGTPIGSMVCDAVVIATMLVVFGTNLVDVVAAANVAYVLVFIFLPLAYLSLRDQPSERGKSFRLARGARPLSVGLTVLNGALLIFGGGQWGLRVLLTGAALVLAILPICLATRLRRAATEEVLLADSTTLRPYGAPRLNKTKGMKHG